MRHEDAWALSQPENGKSACKCRRTRVCGAGERQLCDKKLGHSRIELKYGFHHLYASTLSLLAQSRQTASPTRERGICLLVSHVPLAWIEYNYRQPWRITQRGRLRITPELEDGTTDARRPSSATFSSRNGRLGAELAVAAAPGLWRPSASRAANAQPRTDHHTHAALPNPGRARNSHDESHLLDRRSPMSTSPNEPTPHNERASSPAGAQTLT